MRSVYSLIYRLKLIAPLLTSVMGSPYPEEWIQRYVKMAGFLISLKCVAGAWFNFSKVNWLEPVALFLFFLIKLNHPRLFLFYTYKIQIKKTSCCHYKIHSFYFKTYKINIFPFTL
jgi:hypothetical protein